MTFYEVMIVTHTVQALHVVQVAVKEASPVETVFKSEIQIWEHQMTKAPPP